MENICKSGGSAENDVFYRYKMPTVRTQVKGNGTIILNIDQIALALDRSPVTIMSFIGKRLGTASSKNEFRGVFTASQIKRYLQEYIEVNVLCGKCENPETIVTPKGRQCKACGHISE